MSMTVHETLKAMRELLSDEKRWTQGGYARDANGRMTESVDGDAVCWCLMGAANKITNYLWDDPSISKHFNGNIAKFNDTHTHAEVLAKLDDAIKATAP